MKISELIKKLEECKKKNGDLQVVIAQEAPFPDGWFSTVENLSIKAEWNGKGKDAILLDWRC